MKIYTKTGDKGDTSLAVGGRVRKSNKRLEAYGTADELNSYVGWLRAKIVAKSPIWHIVVDEQLAWVQNRLFDVGAILAGADMEVTEDAVCQLENNKALYAEIEEKVRAVALENSDMLEIDESEVEDGE